MFRLLFLKHQDWDDRKLSKWRALSDKTMIVVDQLALDRQALARSSPQVADQDFDASMTSCTVTPYSRPANCTCTLHDGDVSGQSRRPLFCEEG